MVKRKAKEKIGGLKMLDGILKDVCKRPEPTSSIDIPFPRTDRGSVSKNTLNKVNIGSRPVKKGSSIKASQGDEPSTVEKIGRIFTGKKTRLRRKRG